MGEKSSFVLYHDIRTPLELLPDAERGKLFLAILNYSEFGVCPDFDGALQMAFVFIKTALDRDAVAWEAKREKRREAGSLGGRQRAANQANAFLARQEQANQANQAVPVPVPAPVNVPVNVPVREYTADKPPTRAYGQYGWVKLTEEQHARLLSDLGLEELERCIAYIDESAQGTGNKNKWKDWNLVLRRCSREGWGRRENNAAGGHTERSGSGAEKRYSFSYDVS